MAALSCLMLTTLGWAPILGTGFLRMCEHWQRVEHFQHMTKALPQPGWEKIRHPAPLLHSASFVWCCGKPVVINVTPWAWHERGYLR
ncbi:hypothetical protein BC827DRAFT_1232860 [Russula dissimulans]|nr:hypothetical protein BC827DRAFT_1232860 [Russula dissimulans]